MSPRTCVICGATFEPKKQATTKLTCSDACALELHRKKAREYRKTHLEERRAYDRAWHEKHREQETARMRKWRAAKAAAEGRTIRPRNGVTVSAEKRRRAAETAGVSPARRAEIDRLQRGRDAEALRRHAATWTEAERKFARQNYKEIHGFFSLQEGF